MNEIKSLVCNNDLFYAAQSTTTQAIMLSIHFYHYYLYPYSQKRLALKLWSRWMTKEVRLSETVFSELEKLFLLP